MKILLDTHVLLWAAQGSEKLSESAISMLNDGENTLFFSPINMWEIVIKSGLGRSDFSVDTPILRRSLLDNGYQELVLTSQHTLAVANFPHHHKDPFDRILLAQASVEGFYFLTADEILPQYGSFVIRL